MRRTKGRTSRVFVGIVAVSVGAGVVGVLHKLKSNTTGTSLVAAAKVSVDLPPPAVSNPPIIKILEHPLATTQPIVEQPKPIIRKDPPKPEFGQDSVNDLLSDARSKIDKGDFAGARRSLNDAFVAGRFQGSDYESVKSLLSKISEQTTLSPRFYREDTFGYSYTVQSGDRLTRIAATNNVNWEFLCRLNGISDPHKLRALQTLKIIRGPFHAVVTKSKFVIDLYLGAPGGSGSVYVTSFPVGIGKNSSTPTGTWKADRRLKDPAYYSPRGEGVIATNDPKNPLGKYWIGLTGTDGAAKGAMSYGIHGTIEPESIGKESSMGCIRLRNEDAQRVYELLVEGKSIVVVRD